MTNTPIDSKIVKRILEEMHFDNVANASIREIVRLANRIEEESGEKFIRMEMGVPGIDVSEIAFNAEVEAFKSGVASKYAPIAGIEPLKKEISRFVKNFLDIDISPEYCFTSVGSAQASIALFMVACRTDKTRRGVLFIDPGFPVQKLQIQVLGYEYDTFDVFKYRGEKLRAKLEELITEKKISSILYSNPNNPTWISFTDEELQIIGELATKYNLVVIEDLAYFGMDFRKDYSVPGEAPFQPTIAKYTDNWTMLISSSKVFSYAGQRVGMLVVSEKIYNNRYPDLKRFYTSDQFGHSLVYNALYTLSAGVSHTPQYGLAALLKAVNDGKYNFRDDVKVYGERAKIMKKMFLDAGFELVYDNDMGEPLADGFYFTISYPGMRGSQLLENLLYHGISAIALQTTGSERREGLRACVSQIGEEQIPVLEERLKRFKENFGQ
ncbi:MAG: pyridoxal phosphate-dependent aminotransferase [Bacteroidales bacterium]|nr:pyridoxal phosphate-dependent aminotransferase [Bacteroidales bacterium]